MAGRFRVRVSSFLRQQLLLHALASGADDEVPPGSFLAGRTLRDSRPWDRGVVILAIKRDGQTHSGLPVRDDLILAGDALTAYGKESALQAMTQPLEQPGTKHKEP